MNTLLLSLLVAASVHSQFGIGSTWTYRGKSPYTEKVIGITTAPLVGKTDQMVRIAYTDHGRAFGTINGVECVGHKTAEGFTVVAASGGGSIPVAPFYQLGGDGQWGNRRGEIAIDGRTGGMGWGPEVGVICTWAISGKRTDTTTMLHRYSLKKDATSAAEQQVTKLLTADKRADERRNDRRISFGTIQTAFGDCDADGDVDAAAVVTWEYGGSGYEQRLYVMLNKRGKYSQKFGERIALKGDGDKFGKWLTIDVEGVHVYQYDNGISRWVVRRGKVKQAKVGE